MAKKPDFNDASWDATVWSLWGLLYTGAASDTALKSAISQTFGEAKKALSGIGVQVDPLAELVQDWRDEVAGYARTITFGQANEVLLRLRSILADANEQAASDRLLVLANKKPPPKLEKAPTAQKKTAALGKAPEFDSDDEAWALLSARTVSGHSKATARAPHKTVKPKLVYVPPSEEQLWKWEQKTMANHCDNGIAYGTHGVDQPSVLQRLDLQDGDSVVKQFREGPANSHLRILNTRDGAQYWTLGLTHKEKRDLGQFSVYRRVGTKSLFVFVSGNRHPKDPGL